MQFRQFTTKDYILYGLIIIATLMMWFEYQEYKRIEKVCEEYNKQHQFPEEIPTFQVENSSIGNIGVEK